MQRQSLESGRRSNERGRESWRKRGEGKTGHKSCKCHDCYCNKTTHIPLSQYFLLHSTTVNMTTQRVLFHARQSYAFSNVYFLSTPTAGNNLTPVSVLIYSSSLQASNQLYKMRLSKAREVTKYMYEMYT